MGFLVRIGLLAGVGAALYKFCRRDEAKQDSQDGEAAATTDPGDNSDAAPVHSSGVVRNAGRKEHLYAEPDREWDKVDEQSDESFPASDPPANY